MTDPTVSAACSSALLIEQFRGGDQHAADELFARYAERLTRLARSRLAAKLAARVDPEDIVLSAYRSFFVRAREGRFELAQSGDLWRLLVEVTLHKLYRQAERHGAARRSVAREQPSTEGSPWLELAARQPTPDEAAIAAEEVEALLAALPPSARPAIELRLQGYELEEIAADLKCSERTVRRWLKQARQALIKSGAVSAPPWASSRESPVPRVKRNRTTFEPQAGELRWSDYILQEQIGAGATGKVYRAVERSTDRVVAVKFLKKALVGESAVVEQFLREVRLVSELAHPGIVAVQGIGRTPAGGYFLVMELVRGRDLHALASSQAIMPADAAQWIASAGRTVHHAHQRGVIHCDLKPSNLLLDEQGSIRVTDFGLAVRLIDAPYGTIQGGTPAFMAPEQVDSCWGNLSPRTDVWGLAVVLYFLLFGQAPHVGRTVAEVLARVVSGQSVEFPSRPLHGIPLPLIEACRRGLAKQASERFASAAELADALDPACSQES